MIPIKLPFRLPPHIIVAAEPVENPALCRLRLTCDHCGGEEDWEVDADRELRWTAGRFLDRHRNCPPGEAAGNRE
ncbi:MAG: hypothetical protein ACR2PL_10355 [Dehalococcoidia bacterium]